MSSLLPPLPPRRQRTFEVLRPNLGLYLGQSALTVPDRGFVQLLNARVRGGEITNEGIGFTQFLAGNLGNQVLMIDLIRQSNGAATTVFGTKSDLFRFDSGTGTTLYLTPIYDTGTVSVTNGSATVTGSGTTWTTNVKAGDQLHVGAANQNSVSAAWVTVSSIVSDTEITLSVAYAGATASGQSYTVRKLFTADDSDTWSTEMFPEAPVGSTSGFGAGDRWFATNGSELVAWDASADQVVVIATATTGLAFTCKDIAYYKNMLLFGFIVESGVSKPTAVKNSAIGDPENVTTLEANEFVVAEGVDFLRALRPLGDLVVGYCEKSINVMQFVGVPTMFAIRTVSPTIGLYASRCVADFGNFHEFLGNDQAYRFDGVRLVPYAGHVLGEVLSLADRSRSFKALAAVSEEEQEVYWVIPLSTDGEGDAKSAEMTFVEHFAESVGSNPTPFSQRELPATAIGRFQSVALGRYSDFPGVTYAQLTSSFNSALFTSDEPVLLFGDETGRVFSLNTQTGDDVGVMGQMAITSPVRAVVDGSTKGLVRRIEPYFKKGVNSVVTITVRTGDRVEGDTENSFGTFNSDHSGNRFSPQRAVGRYAQIVFRAGSGSPRTLTGYRVVIEATGER